jgi:peptidoglycan/LPS O-acetylase OafA/YrhL
MTERELSARIHGLDTLRAAAIILVLAYHYMVVVSGKNTFGFLTEIGWTGVDLFFVLSGYLIGNQIFSVIARKGGFSLKTFYMRRLLRTLPNYYVVLALYLLFPAALGGRETAPLWQFLTFTQNFGMRPGATFTHSWSLCIEEQFYLILPAVALVVVACKRSLRLAWFVLCAAIVAGMVVRSRAWLDHGGNAIGGGYYENVYYSSLARFDELLPGVAIALLKNFHADAYARIMGKGNALLFAGAVAVATMFYLFSHFLEIEDYGPGFPMTVFGYPLLAVSFALLTMSALSPLSLLHRVRVPGAASVALWSYAIYLAHKPIFKVVMAPLAQLQIDTDSWFGIALVMTLGVAGGWLLYRLIEMPFMRLRARLYPVEASRQGAGTPATTTTVSGKASAT